MVQKRVKNIIILIMLLCPVISYVVMSNYYSSLKDLQNVDFYIKSEGYNISVDSIEYEGEEIIITGWMVNRNKNNERFNKSFGLLDEQGNFAQIVTARQNRQDVTDYFNDGNNYSNSGLVGKLNSNELDSGEQYEVVVLEHYTEDEMVNVIKTGRFIQGE